MVDLSAEPSMEEILSSIKRIIAEEGDGSPQRPRRQSRAAPTTTTLAPPPHVADDDEEVLELSDPIPTARAEPEVRGPEPKADRAPTAPPGVITKKAESKSVEPIVSAQAAAASRGALDSLSRMMVKPEPGSDGSLESLVREMLRPMLREWLDLHLPELVEAMVEREIKRITGQAG